MDIPQIHSESDGAIGTMGQIHLAAGKQVAMRQWREQPSGFSESHSREYETVGFLLSGVIEIELDGGTATIQAGDSWLVPEGAPHRYRIVEPIVAIEATSPPACFGERDEIECIKHKHTK
ncbi:cupin domain-containing protein [Novipirellula sp. SH528]|uniref:cupin domain-containing protein n=1 Tax=Novipirellula sp. SH528 TaxID=3454466 RepID=UPI003FA043D2